MDRTRQPDRQRDEGDQHDEQFADRTGHHDIELSVGSRVLVVSDMHIPPLADANSAIVCEQLSVTIDALHGPGVVVFAGDCFDMTTQAHPDPSQMLAEHPRLSGALERYASGEGRHIAVLAGRCDLALVTSEQAARPLLARGWHIARTLDLRFATGSGPRVVRVEHGSQWLDDPTEPAPADLDRDEPDDADERDTIATPPVWLAGEEHLEDSEANEQFFRSRWLTRRLLSVYWPVVVGALLAEFALAIADPDGLAAKLAVLWAVVLVVASGATALWLELHANAHRRAAFSASRSNTDHRLRAHGAELTANGYSALVCGATHRPELSELGQGRFVANTGSCDDITVQQRSWIGLPLFRTVRQMSWVELEGANELQMRLVVGRTPPLTEPLVESLLARRNDAIPRHAVVVAAVPYGPTSWSPVPSPIDWTRRTRRAAAIALWSASTIDIASAATRPLAGRAHLLAALVPLTIVTSARVAAAALGALLALVAIGVRRGRRSALVAALVLLIAGAATHIVKGIDVEESLLSLALALWLILNRRAFAVRRHRAPRTSASDFERARRIVEDHGGDTLAYFALRDDKLRFFTGESLVAYAIVRNICLVSPDPIGPTEERARVWRDFREFARRQGWTVAVVGAGPEWLALYRSDAMFDLYIGDEAIVDVQAFTVQGGANKSLRHGVNRVRKRGYRVEFFNAASVGPELQTSLRALMGQSRRGDVERGFSMTLGRVFDPRDDRLLLAVAFGPDDQPAAFCQYVPAAAISGYSLDLMRRSETDMTNGLIDFVIVETVEHLRHLGYHGLGLNFATLRTVVSGESEDGALARVERWAVERLGDSMQIESLWRYNEKFRPAWRPRYAVLESRADVPAAMLAYATAESWWELPLIGRFVAKRGGEPTPSSEDT